MNSVGVVALFTDVVTLFSGGSTVQNAGEQLCAPTRHTARIRPARALVVSHLSRIGIWNIELYENPPSEQSEDAFGHGENMRSKNGAHIGVSRCLVKNSILRWYY